MKVRLRRNRAPAALDFAPDGGYYVRAAASACFFFLSGKMSLIGDRTGIKLPKELEEELAAK